MGDATTRRTRLADAAIATLAASGMRGLTHRAVDKAADLAEGSCSYYFRTRESLLRAAVDRLVELDAADVTSRVELADTTDLDATTAAVTALFEAWTGPSRHHMLARYELELELTRRPELRTVLTLRDTRFLHLAERVMTALGAPRPAEAARLFVNLLDGLLFRQIIGAREVALTPGQARVAVRGILESCARRD